MTRRRRFNWLLSVVLVLSALATSATSAASGQKTIGAWEPIYRGVWYAEGSNSSPLQRVYALRVDTENPFVEFMATPSNGAASGDTALQTTPAFLAEHGLSAAINANFYTWAPGSNSFVEGLLISNGDVVSAGDSGFSRPGQLRITAANVASLANTTATPSGVHTAIAGASFPLINGTPLGSTSGREPRTELGLSSDSRHIVMIVIDGRQPGYSSGATIREIGEWLKDFGASIGIDLDGGGSSTLVTADGGVRNLPSDAGGPRSVGANFGFKSAPLTFDGTIDDLHALQFDGLDNFVDITEAAGTFGDFTISGWFNIKQKPTPQFPTSTQFLYRITNRENNTRFIDLAEIGGTIRARLRTAVNGTIYTLTSSVFEYDTWIHIAFVRTGAQIRLYFNGQEVASAPAVSTPVVVARKSYLGANPHPWADLGREFFYGSIDEFQIWNVARTAQEIAGSMFEPLEEPVAPGSGLRARFGFNEGSGDWAYDYVSGNDFIARVNAAWVESDIAGLAPPPALSKLNVTRNDGQIVLTWDEVNAQLQWAFDLAGPWFAVGGATSPYVVDPAAGPRRFFRLCLEDCPPIR